MMKITFADGTVIDNLTTNGTYFVSVDEVNADLLKGIMRNVLIEGTSEEDTFSLIETGTHKAMKLTDMRTMDGKCCFTLADVPYDELEREILKADIAYLAMMTDTDM